MSCQTNKIIIIQAADPDGSIFRKIREVLDGHRVEVMNIDAHTNSMLVYPGLTIQAESGTVLREGSPIQLNYGEFSVLCHLARHPGMIFSKKQLYTAVYGEDLYNSNTVQTTICRLRSKIEPDPHHPTYIKTVVGFEYKFDPKGARP